MIKKRTITAIILTALVIILTSNIWHSLKPVFVDFDIQSKGKCNIEVQLNRKDTDEFKKSNDNLSVEISTFATSISPLMSFGKSVSRS